MTAKDSILRAIQENEATIKTYGVKQIGLFGSFVRLSHKNKSDIDILVEFRKGKKTFDNYMELKFFLQKLFHRKVDLVIKEALKPQIKPHILQEVQYAQS